MEDVNENSPLLTPPTHCRDSTGMQSKLHSLAPLPWMDIRCYRIRPTGGRLQSCSLEECLQNRQQDIHYWIDIEADWNPQRQPLFHEWLLQLGLPTFALEILASSPETWFSQVVPLPRAALALLRILPSSDSDQMQHSAALLMSRILLTLTTTLNSSTSLHSQILLRLQQQLHVPSSSGALMAWLGFHLERTSEDTRTLRSSVLAMESADRLGTKGVDLMEIHSAKEQAMRLFSVAEEQTECLESLVALKLGDSHLSLEQNAAVASLLQASLPIKLAMTRATERLALRLEHQIVDLRKRKEKHDQEIMNRRLADLTVLSAVFMPLTLFTGIWGMNFENMPELRHPYSYPLALLFMMTIAITMIAYFWRTGWFY